MCTCQKCSTKSCCCGQQAKSCCQSSCSQECCCASSCQQCSCGCSKSCQCCQDKSCDKMQKLLAIADMAWAEVLKEKIKEIIKSRENKMDELAAIVAEANKERWKHKMNKEKCSCDYDQCSSTYENKLKELFGCGSQCQTKPSK